MNWLKFIWGFSAAFVVGGISSAFEHHWNISFWHACVIQLCACVGFIGIQYALNDK